MLTTIVVAACVDTSPVKPNPVPAITITPKPIQTSIPKPTVEFPTSVAGETGCAQWTILIDSLSGGSRTESIVRPHFIKLILSENFPKTEQLYERHFSQAVEPELKERGAAVAVASRGALEFSVDLAATYLTDACYYYGHESPF